MADKDIMTTEEQEAAVIEARKDGHLFGAFSCHDVNDCYEECVEAYEEEREDFLRSIGRWKE